MEVACEESLLINQVVLEGGEDSRESQLPTTNMASWGAALNSNGLLAGSINSGHQKLKTSKGHQTRVMSETLSQKLLFWSISVASLI